MQTQLNERKIIKSQSVNAKPLTKSIELRTGVRLEYVEQGEVRGLPVIFLHGLSDSWRSFELLLPYLPASIHAFALSQRGHGDSRRPQSGYRVGDFAADVAAFIDAQQIESAVIVGHSMGSFIAQRFALDYPERTRGLVLLGSCTTLQDNPAVAEFRDALAKFEKAVDFGFALEFQQSTLAQAIPPSFLVTVVQESLKVPAQVWKAALEGLFEEDFSNPTNSVNAPTLIVWGDRDAFFPASEQQALTASIAGSQLLIYENAGHALHWEEPRRVAADLLRFIEGLPQVSRSL
jgi:pimeloyl-ACP methyl ester carboxylesterase